MSSLPTSLASWVNTDASWALRPDAELSIYQTDGATPEKLRIEGGFAEVSAAGLTVLAEAVRA